MRFLAAYFGALRDLLANPIPAHLVDHAHLCPDLIEPPTPEQVRAAYRAQLVEGLIDGWAREIEAELDAVLDAWSA